MNTVKIRMNKANKNYQQNSALSKALKELENVLLFSFANLRIKFILLIDLFAMELNVSDYRQCFLIREMVRNFFYIFDFYLNTLANRNM